MARIAKVTGMGRRRSSNTLRRRRKQDFLTRPLFRLLVLCLLMDCALFPQVALGQTDSAGEYELKAAMLYHLTLFVEWPPSAYPNSEAPTILCILGRDPFGNALTSVVSGQPAARRRVEVRHMQNANEVRTCQVLYIGSSEKKNIVQVLSALRGASVLTVGEMAQFATRGGMIQFSLEEKQVRFDINLDEASQADLKISSKLLTLSRIVKDQAKKPGG